MATVILVAGGTGQVGSLVVRRLLAEGRPVRVLTRNPRAAGDLAALGAELVEGDLRDRAAVELAAGGATGVVATANAAVPASRADALPGALDVGFANLVEAAEEAGATRFVLASVPASSVDDTVPLVRTKRAAEERLRRSPMSSVSLQLAPFTEVWLALAGSSIPLRGEDRVTLHRPYRFLSAFRVVTGTLVERRGLLVVPGPASNRNAFISTHDVAAALVAALDATDVVGEVQLGGPEVLSWEHVAQVFADVLARPVRVVGVPEGLFHVQQQVLGRLAPGAANIMALNRFMARVESAWDTSALAGRLGLPPMRTVGGILRTKAGVARAF